METGRYNRQELIEGWNQDNLKKARVVLVGANSLANFTSASLAALGIGNLEIYDASKAEGNNGENSEKGEFLLFQAKKDEAKVKALETILKEMNPESRFKGMAMKLEASPLISLVGKPDLIIDLTNSPKTKETVLDYARSKKITAMSASADDEGAELHLVIPGEDYWKALLPGYSGRIQSSVPSEVLAGMITEEARKILMPIGEEKPVKSIAYSTRAENRFSGKMGAGIEIGLREILNSKKILIVGAGALGNFAALGAALAGIGSMDILDYDEVDSTNLNRQILFYDAVGRKKAEALAEKISKISPKTKIAGIIGKLDENSRLIEENKYDLIMDCVDSFAVRAIINYFAVRNRVPLVSGGTNPSSGQVTVYVPGETACLDCRLGVEEALGKERTSASCKHAPDPSVIMTNEIIGGLMIGEARKVLYNRYGKPISRILKYESKAPCRGGLIGPAEACICQKPEAKIWIEELIGKYAVKKD